MNSLSKLLNQRPIAFAAHNTVLLQGEIPRQGFYVLSGAVKIYTIDELGNERVVGFSAKGDIFPVDWLLNCSSSSIFYYETIIHSQLIPIDKTNLTKLNQEDPKIAQYIRNYLAQISANSLLRNLALQQSSAQFKLLFFLYFLAVSYGSEVNPGVLKPGLPLTHQLIANSVGLTRETVAMELSNLKKAGVIVYRRKYYLIDKKLLMEYVGKSINTT